jgi:serine/threonine protein kinase
VAIVAACGFDEAQMEQLRAIVNVANLNKHYIIFKKKNETHVITVTRSLMFSDIVEYPHRSEVPLFIAKPRRPRTYVKIVKLLSTNDKSKKTVVDEIPATMTVIKQLQCTNLTSIYDIYMYNDEVWVTTVTECTSEGLLLNVIKHCWTEIRGNQILYITREVDPLFTL